MEDRVRSFALALGVRLAVVHCEMAKVSDMRWQLEGGESLVLIVEDLALVSE